VPSPKPSLHTDGSDPQHEEQPPILGTWRALYIAVIAWLVVLILAFYWFARRFAP
jgi:hypothetical protein